MWVWLIATTAGGVTQRKSWCRIECAIDNPTNLCVAGNQADPPPLVSEH